MMHHHHQPSLPPMPVYGVFDVEEMISAATRLSALLTEENALLTAMRLQELGALQEEKRALTQQVESFQRMIATDNTPVKTADPTRRDILLTVTENLMGTIEHNLQLTRNAQYTNRLVMQTIVDAMTQQHRVGTYGSQGQTRNEAAGIALSVNLNERA